MATLPHAFMVRIRPDVGPPPAGPAFVSVEYLEPVSESAIGAVEAKIGRRLPEDYREFLRQYGDVYFYEGSYFRKEPALRGTFGLRSISAHRLAEYWPHLYEYVPSYLLPFARSMIDDTMFISLGTSDFGRIFVRPNDAGYWDESRGECMAVELCAESFHELIIGTSAKNPDNIHGE